MSASAAVNALTVCKPWTREEIAARAARDIPEGFYVNIGIGIPVLVANYVPPEREVIIHSENGILGMGPEPEPEAINRWLINASKKYVTLRPGGARTCIMLTALRLSAAGISTSACLGPFRSRRTAISPTGRCPTPTCPPSAAPWILRSAPSRSGC